MKNFFISGASRGIGLGLAETALSQGNRVIAGVRNFASSPRLQDLKIKHGEKLLVVELDLQNSASLVHIEKLAATLGIIDVLINNAGIMEEYDQTLENLTIAALEKVMWVDAIAPVALTQALIPALKLSTHPVVINITSGLGSLAYCDAAVCYGYRMAKAALNMFTRTLSFDPIGVTAVALHPGWVRTDLGGPGAPVEVSDSVAGLYKIIDSVTSKDNGKFYDYLGKELPW
jgi:NAD(P)-dependent dehydrogenase (short-subunit alcohol dehydrogenase family)